jgi:integrase
MVKIKVLFFLKKNTKNDTFKCPIYGLIKVGTSRSSFSTGRNISPERWKKTNGLSSSRRIQAEIELKELLNIISDEINSIYLELLKCNYPIYAQDVKNKYLGKNITAELTILTAIEEHNKYFRKRVIKGERSTGTLEKYERVQMFLAEYIQKQFGTKDYPISKVDSSFVFELEDYFKFVRPNQNTHSAGIGNNTAVKYMRSINTALLYGLQRGLISENPFRCYNGRLTEVETTFLTKDELQSIENKSFISRRLETVRDIFIFSCYTSYAPVDSMKLTWEDIAKDDDGDLWIITKRKKSNVDSNALLLPGVLSILEKYKDDPRCIKNNRLLPNISNQKMNEYLKEIAVLCNIQKNLTWYVARHTFATTVCMGNQVPLEYISKMMGHRNVNQTQHYAKLQDATVKKGFIKITEGK